MDAEMTLTRWILISLCVSGIAFAAEKKDKPPQLSPLDRYIEEAMSRPKLQQSQGSAGSLWSPESRLTALGSDLRATQVDDLITIVVMESASAVAQGTTKTQRQSTLNSSIGAIGGPKSPAGALQNLANVSTQSQLNGEGATSRSTQLTAVLSARVTKVLPNGYLVVEGVKEVGVNSERQVVMARGVVRPVDLSTGNTVRSDQIAQLELRVNGKGVIGDAVRRPFILYRLLMGLLPF